MRKFVSSMILSMIMTLSSLCVIFFLQAPLISFVYYGFFSESNVQKISSNIINKMCNRDSITIIILLTQIILTYFFVFALFSFITKVIHIFLRNEKLIRPYYIFFFFMTLILPVILIFLSIFLKMKLSILTIIFVIIFTGLNTVLILMARKILPETVDTEYRKYLFTEGAKYE